MAILVVWSVDPFNELNRNTIGLFFSTGRQAGSQIIKTPHDAIIMGSSKVDSLNPEDLGCYTFFKAAFPDALPEEMYHYLKKYLTNEKMVALGVDFYIFNERQWPVLDIKEWPDHTFGVLEYLTSFNALKSSFIALHKKFITQSEPLFVPPPQQEIKQTVPLAKRKAKKHALPIKDVPNTDDEYDYQGRLNILSKHHYRRFQFSHDRMEYLVKIKNMLDKNKTPYIIFINPMNHHVYNLIKELGYLDLYHDWKDKMQRLYGDHLFDFSQGVYSANMYYGTTDPWHYKAEVGANFLNSILTCDDE